MVETPSNIYDEYFNLTEKYKKMYNGCVVVLLQVGAFFEIYGIYVHPKYWGNKIVFVSIFKVNKIDINIFTN